MGGYRNRSVPIPFVQPNVLPGFILAWAFAIVDIPAGWVLCDGNNGTPDLRGKNIIGAGGVYNVGDTDGSLTHDHPFTSDNETPEYGFGPPLDITIVTPNGHQNQFAVEGTTDAGSSLSPVHALAFIMKT